MIEKLELHHLKTLAALLQFHNISLAAESLNLSQQAVSAKLKRLRNILGDNLFIREGHGIVPTPYARSIQSYVESLISQLNAFPLPASNDISKMERQVVISATDYAQAVILPKLINKLRQVAPLVKVIVCNIEVAALTKKMSQGDIDLALTTSGYVPDGLISTPLFIERYVCVEADLDKISKDTVNREGNPQPPTTVKDLVQRDFVVVNPGTASLTGSAEAWFSQQGMTRHVSVSAPTFYMAQEYIKASDMVGFIPSRLLPITGLRVIELEKTPPGYQVVAAYHAKVKNDELIRFLLEASLLDNPEFEG
ncbi:LysR family transcriptional regulator [Marinomonas sp. PE14-40]|uniref:LysR family transcriptional regulator n=1 Tax=Marinomonas sp. PE14-40 TaxID=3060621 RepID=UPI003F67CCE4